jgi:hypothetical protein
MKLAFRDTLHVILAQRLWQAASGTVTIVLVTTFLTPEQQGWYYSLLSLAALYTLFDLGLSYVLVQAAAHTFVGLRWRADGGVEGRHADRFAALAAWSSRHYGWLALGFAVIVTPLGLVFFGTTTSDAISWRSPWLVLALASAGALLLLPFQATIEGSGEVAEVYAVRLAQGVLAAAACWVTLAGGGGLWAIVMAPLAAILVQGAWLAGRRPALLASAWEGQYRQIDWRGQIWPHQWQIGLAWLSGYLLTQVYIPVLFKTQDAVVAGQMGLSLTASNMLGLLSQSWITRHVPAMAAAASTRQWDQFDSIFARDLFLSCVAFLAGAAALCLLHQMLGITSYAGRLLPFWPFGGLLAAGFLGHVHGALAAHLRSFRREPLVWVSVAGALLTAAGASWGAWHYSAAGIVIAMLTIQIVVVLPASILLWRKRNLEWRTPVEPNQAASDHRDPDLEPRAIPCPDP